MAITDWPLDQRPRERLIRLGAKALSEPELLAVFLRVGVRGKSAVDLGRELIAHFGSLNGLFGASLEEFSKMHGLGPAKFAQLQAVLELARRALGEDLACGITLSAPRAVRDYLQLLFANQAHESFVVLFLDVRNRLIEAEEMFRGSLTHTSVYPREVMKAALRLNAAGMILSHNHPSGCAEPSPADIALTRTLQQALLLVDIRVLDHFIVAGSSVYSFAEQGRL